MQFTRCWKCGTRLEVTDEYGDYLKFEKQKDGSWKRKSEARPFDADWVIENHWRKQCSKNPALS